MYVPLRPSPGIMVSKGNHPQMAELFRLVKYYNLPRYMFKYGTIYVHVFLSMKTHPG